MRSIEGTWGILVISEEGYVLGYDKTVWDDPGYDDIARFDVPEYIAWCMANSLTPRDHIDILFIGYWYGDGKYEPAEPDFRRRHITGERP